MNREAEESIEGPKASGVFEWGPSDQPKHRYQMLAVPTETRYNEGVIWHVSKKPKPRKNQEDEQYTARIVMPNPNGMLYQLWQKGEVTIEPRSQFVQRTLHNARTPDSASRRVDPNAPSERVALK
eukprot:CAMPEP_0184693382 /NCGR_PEP_ID=MMETSP0313-20130426/1622_1 /TAXON_ID=2792 /ORGANISM="Porphyridium aerugineum, Strain SAG 1380-2" /LENGTH=124 /DNA_ID=CAMNT_0027151451 /DNA_START=56 /DNA_END=430 /DNA_ORIENTATION=-